MRKGIWAMGLGLMSACSGSAADGEGRLRVGGELHGFQVTAVTELPDISGRLWRMTYGRNGADLVWLERDDANMTFAIAFKTVPEDDTGVAHVIEHSVLCGSERFPVKEPFVELLKSSYATFVNAWTGADCTSYPIATKNPRDYLNLVEVYLDAVFHPLSVKSDWAMRQEGWHYEFDGTNLVRNGIVYSEMKGAFGDPHAVAWRELGRVLFPDNAYGRESGGDPASIPELTFGRYKAFYERFYHPSNARIFLDGRIDLPAVLKLLDGYLREYGRREIDVSVPHQKPVAGQRRIPYECAETGDRVILCDGWVWGTFDDRERELGMDVLCELLAGSNEAPLKKALLEEGLCDDLALADWGCEQLVLSLLIRNTSEQKAGRCRKLVRETLERLCREGLDQARIAAVLDREEFRLREQDTDQRGLAFFRQVSHSWLYGGDPAVNLGYSDLFARVRARIGTGWFERLLREAVLDNPHHGEITLVPSRTLADERRAAERAELDRILDGLSSAQREAWAAETKAFKALQATPDSAQELAKLPRIGLSDLSERGDVPDRRISTVDGFTVIRPEVTVPRIVYFDLFFPLAGLSDDELLDVPLLASVLGELGTESYPALQLRTEMESRLGGFSVRARSFATGPYLVVRLSALESRKDDLIRLAGEVLLRTRFDDGRALSRLRAQCREGLEREARSGGREMVQVQARRGLSERGRLSELFFGLSQLDRLRGELPPGRLESLVKRIFVRDAARRLLVGVTGSVSDNDIRRLLAEFPPEQIRPAAPAAPQQSDARGNMGFVADGSVGYAAMAARLPTDGALSRGAMFVGAKVVTLEHLWNEIRVKGGAYGGGLCPSLDGDIAFASWRDPNPAGSLGHFRRSAQALEAFVASGHGLERYQVATAKITEPNLSPSEKALYVCELQLNGREPETLRALRREIRELTAKDLLRFARVLSEVTTGASVSVFANEGLLGPCGLDRIVR